MLRLVRVLVPAILAAKGAIACAAEPEYVLHSAKAKTIRARFDFEIHTPHLTADEWVVFAAQIPSLVRQGDVRTTFHPTADVFQERSPRERTLFRARVPATDESLRHAFHGRIEYAATLYSRQLAKRTAGEGDRKVRPPSDAERELSLRSTPTLDFESAAFTRWLKENRLHRRRRESELDFGRRVFLQVTRSLRYEYTEKMDRLASHLCEADSADCGGMCVLFVAALRANGIPARLLAGRWAKSSVPDAQLNGVAYNQQHVKAEFYVDDLGWVPVDLSSAVLHDKTPEGLQYFGHDRGDFLVVHVDPDFVVDTIHFGEKQTTFMQGFNYWVTGRGKLDEKSLKMKWTVEVVP